MTDKCLTDILETVIYRCPDLHGDLLNFTLYPTEVDYLAKKILELVTYRSDVHYISYPYNEFIIQVFLISLSLPFYHDIYVYRR